jgi:acyl carrier protein
MEDFKNCVWQFLNQEKGQSILIDEIKWEENFFHEGYIDSLGFYNLLVYLEEMLSVKLPLSKIMEEFPLTFSDMYKTILTSAESS